ncbi:hypothetical protein ANCCEY_06274 [Ancylostoma ceylanicum]|uniref:Uncharacterized protein n=1 Tax=Ancylostoma ceylanicum TaxID=53326 RepID=A0A0D6LRW7_9BILA|nr:hypothetical protein ANCCEY_06274 [Ancylostoma ceylanicum]
MRQENEDCDKCPKKAELRRSHKIIEELRTENALLRKKICDTELLDSNERIEALVEERIKRKMDQLSCISSRTVAHLQKAALNLREAFEDFGYDFVVVMREEVLVGTSSPPSDRVVLDNKRATLSSDGEPSLAVVVESPPLVNRERVCSNMESKENSETSLEDETPARTLSSRKQPRRSELFRAGQRDVQEFEEATPVAISEASPLRRSSSLTNTPLGAAKRAFFETPAVPMVECDTLMS